MPVAHCLALAEVRLVDSIFYRWPSQQQRCPSHLESELDENLAETLADAVIEYLCLIFIIDSLHQ